MKKVVIFIADSSGNSILTKLIMPTLKLLYSKNGWKVTIANPYENGLDISESSNSSIKIIERAYKHYVKESKHVHFMFDSNLGGVNPMIEAIFGHVFIEGFAYKQDIKESYFKNKRVFFYILNTKKSLINLPSIRIRFSDIPKLFKSYKIFNVNHNWLKISNKNKNISKIRNYLIKSIKNE